MASLIGWLTREQIFVLVDQMLAHNEANDAERYKLSKIDVDNSGYTFGRCQHDCGQRSDARDFINSCLVNARVPSGAITEIMSILADHTQDLSDDQLKLVNDALVLLVNVSAINQFDSDHINHDIDYVYAAVNNLGNDDALVIGRIVGLQSKAHILANPKTFLQLVDYHNQLHINIPGPLIDFLNGKTIDRSDLGIGKITLDPHKIDSDLLGEIRRFINGYTKYGLEHPSDCIRRQQHIDGLNIPTPPAGSPASPQPSASNNPYRIHRPTPILPPRIPDRPVVPSPTPVLPNPMPGHPPDRGPRGAIDRPNPGSGEPDPKPNSAPSAPTAPPPAPKPEPPREPPPEAPEPIHNEPPILGDGHDGGGNDGDHGGGGEAILVSRYSLFDRSRNTLLCPAFTPCSSTQVRLSSTDTIPSHEPTPYPVSVTFGSVGQFEAGLSSDRQGAKDSRPSEKVPIPDEYPHM